VTASHTQSKCAVVIVLARGGSKGLPRKNALLVAGRPCLEWTLQHACDAETVAAVVLSTDDAELMAIGRAWGNRVRTIERSAELASDHATVDSAAREALVRFDAQATSPIDDADSNPLPLGGAIGTPIVILYGNVPVRPPGLIDRAVRLLVESRADSVQSYAPVGKHHPWWTARVDEGTGAVRPWQGEVLNHGVFRRQELPPAFIPDGGVIALTREALMLQIAGVAPGPHAFFGRDDRRRGLVNREGDVVDIDTEIDRMVAESVLSRQDRIEARSA